jgi:hypothetical protein
MTSQVAPPTAVESTQAGRSGWPPYAAYQARVDREIRIFRLSRRKVSGA